MGAAEAIQKAMISVFKLLPDGMLYKLSGEPPIVIRGRTLDPMMQVMWVQGKKQPAMTVLTPQDARAGMNQALAAAQMKPRVMQEIIDREIPGPAGMIPVRVYVPPGLSEGAPVMVYFHQGGCVIGDVDTCHPFCTHLADEARCIVVNVEYRMAPEDKFPAAVDDAIAAYAWATKSADEYGGDPKRIGVGGDSAGGMLSAVITHAMKREGGQQPVLQMLLYPWLAGRGEFASFKDFGDCYPLNQELMDWFGGYYFGNDADRDDWRASPLHEADFCGLAPAIVATAGFDPLTDEGEAYANKLEAAGVPVKFTCYEGLTHSFTALGGACPTAARACHEVIAQARSILGS